MKRRLTGYDVFLFILCVLMVAFIMIPLVIVVIMSFNSVSYSIFPPESFSVRWYENLATQTQFFDGFWNSVKTSALSTGIALLAGTLAVIATEKYQFKGKNLIRALYMTPMIIPKVTLGVAFLIYFSKIGVSVSKIGFVLAEAVIIFPFVMSMVGSGYSLIDPLYEKAASDLGAKPMRILWTITLPQLKGSLLSAAAIGFIFTFDQTEMALMLLKPSDYTLPVELFLYMQKYQDPTIAVISTIMMALAVVFFFIVRGILMKVPTFARILKG